MPTAISRREVLRTGLVASSLLLPFRSPAAAAEALPFLVLGDWGDPGRGQKEVARAMADLARQTPQNFIVSVGDNFYPQGVASVDDPLWNAAFREVYSDPSLACPWYAVLGNHDRHGNVDAEIEFEKMDPRWHMPQRFYSRVEALAGGGEAEFFFLDTTLVADERPEPATPAADQEQFAWLDRALAATKARWRIVVGHHPVFSGGHHGNTPSLTAWLKPLLERHKVQVYLNGHDHDLQHIVADGVHYVTVGSGSKTRATHQTKRTVFAASELGFLSARLARDAMEVAFVSAGGKTLHAATIAVSPG
jgi:tartrate-resistant acid phosphatase type 5